RSSVIANNFIHDRETKASAVRFSGADEGIEQRGANRCRYARSIVGDSNLKRFPRGMQFDIDLALQLRCGLTCVQYQVEECSLHLLGEIGRASCRKAC